MDESTYYTPDAAAAAAGEAASAAAAAGGLAIFGGFALIATLIGIATFVLWLWALIDCIKRNFTNPSDKTLWLVLIIVGAFFLGPILPIIYLIVGRKKGTIAGAAKTA